VLAWVILCCFAPIEQAAVTMNSDQAEAVLALLVLVDAGGPVPEQAWTRLFATEGYRRLQRREAEMNRDFSDADFRAFISGGALTGRRAALAATLARWCQVDLVEAASKVEAYLPSGKRVHSTVYLVIKPRTNSFVFETESDNPAIFLYLDPEVSPDKLANTIAHEFHHIGFGSRCDEGPDELSPGLSNAIHWSFALGEGLAMLAAAGDPWTHPHLASPAADRERWDADVAAFAENLAALDAFFSDCLAEKLDEVEILKRARGFYGIQGPWYTVGWQMAAQLERHVGHEFLLERICRPWSLIVAYQRWAQDRNQAGESWPLWSLPAIKAFESLLAEP